MRIGIDARYLSHGLVGGVHTYVASFIPELLDIARDHQFFLYVDSKRAFELRGPFPSNVTVRCLPWRNALSSVAADVQQLQRHMARDRLDVAHFPANYGFGPASARAVITLHDAINLLPLREQFRGIGHSPSGRSIRTLAATVYLHSCTVLSVRRAARVLTDSEHAQREIAALSGLLAERIIVAPLAAAASVRRVEDERTLLATRAKYGLDGPFVLADALKNPELLLRAWRLLPEEARAGRNVVFFSRRCDVLPAVRSAVESGEARLLARPSFEELISLYSMADAFVFPSWIEGFGLPVLEAMACGAPVVASNRGSIPEISGSAALLCDATDDAALAGHLERVLVEPGMAHSLRERGFAQAARFSWRKTAQRILAAYESAARA